jgi:uncharacterized protein
MDFSWNEAKRAKTLQERGPDFARAGEIFADLHVTRSTHSGKSSETRFVTAGFLDRRLVDGVDTARRQTSRYVDEVRTCERAKALERGNGSIPMMRRN